VSRALAWLGMYDHPAQHAANDALWQAIAERLVRRGIRGVPLSLDRVPEPQAAWSSPDLLFGQICTRPLMREHPRLRVLAHPVYGVEADPGFHHSLIVVRADCSAERIEDLRGGIVAINDGGSNTGVALLRDVLAPIADPFPFFARLHTTGSHRASAYAVAAGDADSAAIDEVTWAALDRQDAEMTRLLRVIGRSPAAATPPFVTARETPIETVAALRLALDDVIADPALAEARGQLFLNGIVPPRPDLFDRVVAQEENAARHGYLELA
jgi:ABC-type phosphate/phosphonate transport system substrate-binding protein